MPTEHSKVSLLIPHPTLLAALVEAGAEGMSLPTFSMADPEPTLPAMQAAIGGLLEVQTPVVRTVVASGRGEPPSLLVEVEPSVGEEPPAGWRWQPLDAATLTALTPETVRGAVTQWVSERDAGWSPLRPPWSRAGWFAEASEWLARQTEAAGASLVGVPHQHQLWDISTVVRAGTTDGDVYLKCSADLFRHEAVVTQALAAATPELMPEVMAVEPTRGWLLMRDFGAAELGEQESTLWHEGVRGLAATQQAWLDDIDALKSLGLPVRTLVELAAQVEALENDVELMDRLPADVRAQWVSAAPALADLCLRLDAIGPGPTLVHGDFHPWNVVHAPGTTRIFDWTDAAVSHPFVDLATYVSRTDDVAVRRQLLDAYVEAWSPHLDRLSLLNATSLGMVVGALYQVMTYRTLLATMPKSGADAGLIGADISWLKRSLTWQERYTPEAPYAVLG